MVEEIGREFKKKQAQLGPLMGELKRVRQGMMPSLSMLSISFFLSLDIPLNTFIDTPSHSTYVFWHTLSTHFDTYTNVPSLRVWQDYMDIESEYAERKGTYDKVAVGLELEKQALERECDQYQDECLREESRFHQLTNLATIARIKLERAGQWQRHIY